MTAPQGRLGVGVVGAGRAGVPIALALAGAGHAILGLSTTSVQNRERVETMLPGVPILDIPTLIERSELVVLAVPDGQIESLVTGLAAVGAWVPGQLVLHLAAGLGVAPLAAATACGAIPIAVHPNIVFTGSSIDIARLRDSTAVVTCPAPVLPIAQAMAIELGCEPIVVAEQNRAAFAEALGLVTSFPAEVVEQAAQILRNIDVEDPAAVLTSVAMSSLSTALARYTTRAAAPIPPEENL